LVTDMKPLILIVVLAALVMAGCAGTPRPGDAGATPNQVLSGDDASGAVHWGGQIVSIKNRRDYTLVEVLALPLESSGRPRVDGKAEGRFIVQRPGFLEPHEYAADRLLEVRGQLDGFIHGTVGDAPYRYPLVQGEQLVLWPEDAAASTSPIKPRVNFGVGLGTYGSGVGIGIGF
ncbi:MAG TPA: Slp family lipoprotein, partial [Gammaproteobacteria bacterium]|nr:Slp family lipoprotein [Gammaproteobacteria bacterium]